MKPPALLRQHRQRGFALLAFAVFLTSALLAAFLFRLNHASSRPEYEVRSGVAMAEAREALIGKAVKDASNGIYGLLQMPDLGTSRNSMSASGEGTAAGAFFGNTANLSVIGRLPWRTLGLAPLRDGQGECLWYAVSGSAQSALAPAVFNWDTLGHFEIFRSDGTPAGTQRVAADNPHLRPLALVFSAGPVLPGQDRQPSSVDAVDQCGGNYDVRNYLDSFTANAAINGIVNYFPGTANNATGTAVDIDAPKPFINSDVDIQSGGEKIRLANDRLAAITARDIFDRVKRRKEFKENIDGMLDGLQKCLSDSSETVLASGDRGIALLEERCQTKLPVPRRSFFKHWQDNLLYASGALGDFTIRGDGGIKTACRGLLFFAGERVQPMPPQLPQQRATLEQRRDKTNYLEMPNVDLFPSGGSYLGSGFYSPDASQADLIRCITAPPAGKVSFQEDLAGARLFQMSGGKLPEINAEEQTVRLSSSRAGSACLWFPRLIPLAGKTLRAWYQYQFMNADTFATTGAKRDRGNGFTLQLVKGDVLDVEHNPTPPNTCGPYDKLGALEMTNVWGASSYVIETDVKNDDDYNDPAGNHTAIMLNGRLEHDAPIDAATLEKMQACNGTSNVCVHAPANTFEESPSPLLHNQRIEIHTGCKSGCSQCNPANSNIANNIITGTSEYARIDVWVDCENCSDLTVDHVDAELIKKEENRIFSGPGDWKGELWTLGADGLVYDGNAGMNSIYLSNSALTGAPDKDKTYLVELDLKTQRLDIGASITLSFGGQPFSLTPPAAGATARYKLQLDAKNAGDLHITPNAAWAGSIRQISLRAVRPPSVRRCVQLTPSMKNVFPGLTAGFLSGQNTAQGVTLLNFELRSD